ncbi:MAG: YdbH domain-containing protein [Kiloniellales bacterium]|nr:YdbH domain-containing protein [Kiloniellales bacterium]
MKRPLVTGSALALGLLVLALAALVAYRTNVAQWWLSDQLTERGFAFASLEVTALGLGEARISGITAGRDRELQVEDVTLTYRWPELFTGRFAGVSVDGLTLSLDLTGRGPPLGSLDEVFGPLLTETGAEGPPGDLPDIAVRNAKVVARTRIGPVVLTADGRLGPVGGAGTPGSFDFSVAGDQGRITGLLDFTIDAASRVDGRFVLRPGSLTWPVVGLELAVAGGSIDFRSSRETLERFEGDLDLEAFNLGGKEFGAGSLAVQLRDEAFSLTGSHGGDPRYGSGFELNLVVEDWIRAPRLDAAFRLGADVGDLPWQLLPLQAAGLVEPTNGRTGLALSVAGKLAPLSALPQGLADPKSLLRQLELEVGLDIRLSDWVLPDQVEAFDANFPLVARLSGGRIEAKLDGRAALRDAVPVEALIDKARLPRQLLGHELVFRLGGVDDEVFELRADLTQPNPALNLHGSLSIVAPGRLSALLSGDARLDQDAGALGLSFDKLAARIRSADLRGLPLGALDAAGRLTGRVGATGQLVTLALDALELEVEREAEEPLLVTASSGTARFDSGSQTLAFEAWRLALPEPALALSGLSATIPLAAEPARPIAFTIDTVEDSGAAPRFAPARLEGEVAPDGEVYRFSAELAGPPAAAPLVLSGVHDPANQSGRLRLAPKTLTFDPNGLQPGDLSPRLAVLEKAAGRAEVEGELTWGPSGPQGAVSLTLEDLSFEAEGTAVAGLGLGLTLSPLLPAVGSPPAQLLVAGRIEQAVPVTDLRVAFRVLPQEPAAVLIEQADFAAMGGRFRVSDTLWVLDRPEQEAVIQVLGLDLETLLDRLKLEGLEGNGEIVGQIPVRIEDGAVIVADAALRAQRPGRLRFKSEAAAEMLRAGGEPVQLLLQALEDFRYDTLTLAGTKDASNEIEIALKLLGNNPAVLEGHPFEFNINLTGNIGPILEALAQGSEVSGEALRRSWRLRR